MNEIGKTAGGMSAIKEGRSDLVLFFEKLIVRGARPAPAARIRVPASTMILAMRNRTRACTLSDVVGESFATIDCGAAMSMASPDHPGVEHGKLRASNYRIQAALGNISGATQHGMMLLDITTEDGQDRCIQLGDALWTEEMGSDVLVGVHTLLQHGYAPHFWLRGGQLVCPDGGKVALRQHPETTMWHLPTRVMSVERGFLSVPVESMINYISWPVGPQKKWRF